MDVTGFICPDVDPVSAGLAGGVLGAITGSAVGAEADPISGPISVAVGEITVSQPALRWKNIASQMRPASKANCQRRRRVTTVIVAPFRFLGVAIILIYVD